VSEAQLQAADGLALSFDAAGGGRIAWRHPDWLGEIGFATAERSLPRASAAPFAGEDDLGVYRGLELSWTGLALPVRTTVRAYAQRALLVFRLEATDDLEGLSRKRLEDVTVAWPWLRPDRRAPGGLPDGARAFAHLYTEFALPVFSDPSLAHFPSLDVPPRPAAVSPLWLGTPEGAGLLLAPLDAFHEQVIGVPRRDAGGERGVACGWHGDLDRAPAGFASELAVWAAAGPRRALEAWGGFLRERHRTPRRSRYADASLSRLSYWTDNGAAYWYRREPGLDVPTTLEKTLAELRDADVPVGCVEIDSWFYPHQQSRPIDPTPETEVPPTGAVAWEPRADILPQGLGDLRRRLGGLPLVLHARHLSSASPYFERHEAWRDGDRAHPVSGALWRELFAQAADWGAVQVEQDWLIECFLGVRGLREAPGRARAWQEALDDAAAEHGLSLLWCMASPADFAQSVALPRVAAVRTSGDYRYLLGNAALWCWLLYGNALARALDLPAFKDVFLSSREGSGWDGDPLAEVEALLASLCAGPVAIGDRRGRSDRALVMRTCREDGVLVKPDAPIAALERCYRQSCFEAPALLVGETVSRHPAGDWVYLLALHASLAPGELRDELSLAELGDVAPRGPVVARDWRSGAFARLEPDDALAFSLAPREWSYQVLCPVLPGGIALFGDIAKHACLGDRRVRGVRLDDGALRFDVLGGVGERVEIHGWSEGELREVAASGGEAHALLPVADPAPAFARDPRSGAWRLSVTAGERGAVQVRIAP